MVDFSKRLGQRELHKPVDPLAIYETLDRASDKGELRRVQVELLAAWHAECRMKRDLILKLHTGQGKTLIGLLMLQSKLNEGVGPALYLCPNNYLVDQTCAQAKQFGIRFCTAERGLPSEFTESKSILVASVQKVFNGRTKFGIGQKSVAVACLVMDDCHACIDSIRDTFTIKLSKDEPTYQLIRDLFSSALENQGAGTFSDIQNGDTDSLLPVPYWEWNERSSEVVSILSKKVYEESQKTSPDPSKMVPRHDIWFVWPLLKDIVHNCRCVLSGGGLEIAPYLCPLELFGSFNRAEHRVFMSATVTDDSFLIKGLRLSVETIKNPLASKNEKWSGEKMILIPSLIHETLDRSTIVQEFAKCKTGRSYGVVALTPSFNGSRDWAKYGAKVVDSSSIRMGIQQLKDKQFDDALVIVNRYDGIDLPDETCRILNFDSRPYSESLLDRYEEQCRSASEISITRLARTIEQGLGRSVRGEKDYCVIVLVGAELIKVIHSTASRKHFSNQTQAQIELGLQIATMAEEEISGGKTPMEALHNLITQCLKRDDGWKAFYIEKMNAINFVRPFGRVLDIYKAELEAEEEFQTGNPAEAARTVQTLIESHIQEKEEAGWYMQEMARYTLSTSKTESNRLQLEAHRKNRYLMRPKTGMQVDRIEVISHRRVTNICEWVAAHKSYDQLDLQVQEVLAGLDFGIGAERFERAFKDLGVALGFASERPEKEWKEGPDNLWGVEDGHFLVVECKSEVDLQRAEINKREAAQMNTACVWFSTEYPGSSATQLLIIPTHKVSRAGPLADGIQIMRKKELRSLTYNVRAFFSEFKSFDFKSLSNETVQKLLDSHKLTAAHFKTEYHVAPRA
jgi:replicative superfamily II helicase